MNVQVSHHQHYLAHIPHLWKAVMTTAEKMVPDALMSYTALANVTNATVCGKVQLCNQDLRPGLLCTMHLAWEISVLGTK